MSKYKTNIRHLYFYLKQNNLSNSIFQIFFTLYVNIILIVIQNVKFLAFWVLKEKQ